MASTQVPTPVLIRQALQNHARRCGHAPAVIDSGGALTFVELWQRACTRAAELGPRPGAIIAIPARSSAAFLVEVCATWLRGAVPMPLDPNAPRPLWEAMTRRASTSVHSCQPWKAVLSVVGGTYRPLVTGGEPPTLVRKAHAVGLGPAGGGAGPVTHPAVALFASPMYLNGPFEFAVRHLLLGGTVAILDRFHPDRWTSFAAEVKPGWVFLAPIQISKLLDGVPPRELRAALAGVATLLHTAAPCPPAVRSRLLAMVDAHVVAEFYGAAEYDGTFARADESPAGALPILGAQLRVVDGTGRPVPTGHVGVIEGSSGAGLGSHYAGEPCATARAWRTVGDHGVLHDTGRMSVTSVDTVGRAIVGGINVALSRVHAVVAAHPAVLTCQIIPTPDDAYGHVLAARVTTDRPLTREALHTYCATRLCPAERPRHLHITSPDQPAPEEADHALSV